MKLPDDSENYSTRKVQPSEKFDDDEDEEKPEQSLKESSCDGYTDHICSSH